MDEDCGLFEAWCAGDARAGEALFRRRVGEITRFFRNKVHSEGDVADLVSQTFLGLVQSRETFRGDSSFRRFAFRVASLTLQRHLRTRYKRAREVTDFSSICIGALAPKTPSSLMMKQRGARSFVDSLRDLSLEDQTVLELKYFEALTGPEIAEVLDLPEGTVRGRIARALVRLREAVQGRLEQTQSPADGTVTADDVERWAGEVRVSLGREADTP